MAAAEKASSWAVNICANYSAEACTAYSYLADCAGGDIVLRWYQNGRPTDSNVTRWLCDQGYPSLLYSKFYPIHGVCPKYGPLEGWPAGKVRPQLEAVMVQWNDHEPVFWRVSPIGCEPGHECWFQFFYPCEPLVPGKEPHIIPGPGGWLWKTEPGRIRPSGGGG
jgi:hypothetical protein